MVLPLFILGFSKASFEGVLVVFSLQALFIHANVRFTFGPLRRLIVTAEFHHWHHGIEPAADNTISSGNFRGSTPCSGPSTFQKSVADPLRHQCAHPR